MKYVLPRRACHNSTVSLRRLSTAGVLALALASLACRKSAVDCAPLPDPLICPEAGAPSFAGDILPNIFQPVCDNCHAPDAVPADRETPYLTNYQQTFGSRGEILTQVFEFCSMPPANAPVPLTDDERQTLLDWLACGAPDSPALDAGTGD
jgi:uncharacterized membrane protein